LLLGLLHPLIREILNADQEPAITSDRWHVVLARWSGEPGEPRFERSIVSEHADSAAALSAARELKASLAPGLASRSRETRDQVIVRRPASESLRNAGRLERRRK
jgi:hypothetical protein